MHKKPLMSRLAQAYEDSKLLYFVTDGEGNCMLDRVTQVDAQIYAMKNGWSIGRHDEKDDTGVKINDEGVEVSYENKDILSEDDFSNYGGM
tara:strand:+ start:211 stop:483 length:273 start_codon:yes stop_codon:yes gene_type:complete